MTAVNGAPGVGERVRPSVTHSKGSVIHVKRLLRSSPELRIVVGVLALLVTGTVVVALISGGDDGQAFADAAPNSVRIQDVKPNVVIPPPLANASTRTFTVDCGTNQNRKFSPDNPVAQPGIKNGAEHLHDFVGNLSTSADSTEDSLDAAGTTCTDGDKSAYFWPVVRIDTGSKGGGQNTGGTSAITCPTVRDKLPAIPDQAMAEVNQNLAQLDQQIADATQRLKSASGRIGSNFINNAILGPLRDKRAATLNRIANAIGRGADRPRGLLPLAECELSWDGQHAGHSSGSGNTATPTVNCPTVRDKLPGIPAQALAQVNENLAQLDKQIAAANERLVSWHGTGGTAYVNANILGPLKQKRTATINTIINTIDRFGPRPTGLGGLATCTIGTPPPAATTPAAPPTTPPITTEPATLPPPPSTTDPGTPSATDTPEPGTSDVPTVAPTTAPTTAPTAAPPLAVQPVTVEPLAPVQPIAPVQPVHATPDHPTR